MRTMQATQVRQLEQMFSGRFSFFHRERSMYSHDMGALPGMLKPLLGSTQPNGVVQPVSEEELVRLARWAAAERVPLVPCGRSSGHGGVLPVRLGRGFRPNGEVQSHRTQGHLRAAGA